MSPAPPWRSSDLPAAPPYSLRNAVRVIGPAAILLGVSLGSGDWLLGPAVVARHGPAVLFLCTVSVVLQALLNTEMARYTLATGESIFGGFMRTRPGPAFWGWLYALLHGLQSCWPGWAAAGGVTLTALFLGRFPREEDRAVATGLGYLVLFGAVAASLSGTRAHRAIVRAEWIMVAWVSGFLLLLGWLVVPWTAWWHVALGFAGPLGPRDWALPSDPDWVLLVALAAFSGAGGTINASLTQWLRDKGFGMAGTVETIPTIIAGEKVHLAQEGRRFPLTEVNLAKWHEWWRYVRVNLWYLWVVGSLAGMGLPALLAAAFLPPGSAVDPFDAAVLLPRAVAGRHGLVLVALLLLTGLWVLVSTQVGIVEGFARSVTDILWTASPRVRAWRGGNPARVHLAAVMVLAVWGCVGLQLIEPLNLILIGANAAALNLVVLSAHTLWVNRVLLPRELRPAIWREAAVVACGLFFAALVWTVVRSPSGFLALWSG